MSAVSLKYLAPKPIHAAVIYALAEMRLGTVVRHLTLEYRPAVGWALNR